MPAESIREAEIKLSGIRLLKKAQVSLNTLVHGGITHGARHFNEIEADVLAINNAIETLKQKLWNSKLL